MSPSVLSTMARLSTPLLRSGVCLAALAACSAPSVGRELDVGSPRATVAGDVCVSIELPDQQHWEVVAAADPRDAQRLLAVGLVDAGVTATQFLADGVVYRSGDGGRSWSIALDLRGKYAKSIDPSCAFGPDGTAYVAMMVASEQDAPWDLALFRSADGGRTWAAPVVAPGSRGIDRPFLAVDDTDGERRGRVYVTGHLTDAPAPEGAPRPPRALTLFCSVDGGRSIERPVLVPMPDTGWFTAPGGIAVLRDGTVAAAFYETKAWRLNESGARVECSPPSPRVVKCLVSTDGGKTVSVAAAITTTTMQPTTIALAADRSVGAFHGRLYAVWDDVVQDLTRVLLAFSTDSGRTWSGPTVVSDNVRWRPPDVGPDVVLPALAVSPTGVVGVCWYDERGSAGREHLPHLGYEPRFAWSRDGGETFLPSVAVRSDAADRGAHGEWLGVRVVPPSAEWGTRAISVSVGGPFLGHTAGLACDAAGAFHPVWVDNRSGRVQVRSATVVVAGAAAPNGSPELARLADVTTAVALELDHVLYDREAGSITGVLRIRNTGSRRLGGPLVVRALTMSGGVGHITAADADNGVAGPGAAWDLTSCLGAGALEPGERTAERTVRFRMTDLHRGAPEIAGFRGNLVHLEARVLAAVPDGR
jgi:hypothetical protein